MPGLTRLAMASAGMMLAHQVAAKSLRDAAFLSTFEATRLPAMVIATTLVVVATVPVFSRLLARFGPRVIVPAGFLLSAIAHVAEWQAWGGGSPWLAVAIYLHVAGFGALLLSGFWSYLSEVFDPASAKASFSRVAAAGTLGGLSGGLVAERLADAAIQEDTLLFLAAAHTVSALGLVVLGLLTTPSTRPAAESGRLFEFDVLRTAPHLRTLAVLIILGTAGAGVVDYLFKYQATLTFSSGAGLQRFFALFYMAIQVLTFAAQSAVTPAVRRFGLGRTISSLPGGLGAMSAVVLVAPMFPLFIVARGVESVLRGSLFRSGYELLFVPMDPAEKRRTKTFLDVTCDRAGDALGALVVQVLLLVALTPVFLTSTLLAVVIGMTACSIWLGTRLDVMYRRVMERRLVGQLPVTPAVIGSETAWTVINLPAMSAEDAKPAADAPRPKRRPEPPLEPGVRRIAELRSGDRARVEDALREISRPDALLVAQVVDLLAWDDVVGSARQVLEAAASEHTGQLTDALLDPATDFAIRRRIPRILGEVPSQRAVNGLLRALDDTRFEVRYQCGRAINRILSKHDGLTVDRARVLAVVERELSVPVQVWRGHKVIDDEEGEGEEPITGQATDRARKGTEHLYSLLAAILPREPLTVAFSGLRSADRSLRGVSLEYFENVLPPGIRSKLHLLIDDE